MNKRKTMDLTCLEFMGDDFTHAETMARALGYTQTAYTSTSALWGLFCLPDRPGHRGGCIIRTASLGLLFVQDCEDIGISRPELSPYREPIEWTRIKNDVNGNARVVCHFLTFIDWKVDAEVPLMEKYPLALSRARRLGGRKYHCKAYGGGIVFQAHPGELDDRIFSIMDEIRKGAEVRQ